MNLPDICITLLNDLTYLRSQTFSGLFRFTLYLILLFLLYPGFFLFLLFAINLIPLLLPHLFFQLQILVICLIGHHQTSLLTIQMSLTEPSAFDHLPEILCHILCRFPRLFRKFFDITVFSILKETHIFLKPSDSFQNRGSGTCYPAKYPCKDK